MTDEDVKQLLNNNERISNLLRDNEALIKRAGYNPPNKNFAVSKEKRVLESGEFSHSESGEIRQSESNNKNQSPGLYLLN